MSAQVERLILLAPIQPAATGNGLAMRAELFRQAACSDFDVQTVVVPVGGWLPRGAASSPGVVVVPIDRARARAGTIALLGDSAWRHRLSAAGALPGLARAASPGLADPVVAALAPDGPCAVHVLRSYLAPLGAAVAERLRARWITLDLDEDDAAHAVALGDLDGAVAYERLLDVFGQLFDGLSAASLREAEAIGERHGVMVEHVPNAVALLEPVPRPSPPTRLSAVTLLFVGNLTYPPNVEAACALVEAVAPQLAVRTGRRVRVMLVGPHDQRVARLAGPDVQAAGFVPDLGPVYAAADVVVVPLRTGGGTRIKLLEAFAYGVPVVASPAAAAGLEVSDGRELLLAEGPDRTAAAVQAIVSDGSLARRLVSEAGRLVRARYCTDVVTPTIRDFFGRAAAARGRVQPSAWR